MARRFEFVLVTLLLGGCAATTGSGGPASAPPEPRAQTGTPAPVQLDASQVERLKRVLPPLLAAMDHPLPPSQVKLGVLNDPSINAANAGGGQFYVTTGLLQKANDEQLTAVLAHETAHEDLGHVAKAQTLGAGLNVAGALLGTLFPSVGAIAPIAGTLVSRAYSRSEEYAADAHGVEILKRAGHPNGGQMMMNALSWIEQQAGGGGGGGFLATHPGTTERIQRLQQAVAHQ
jgi:Zn-dependent protease with chaperone function